MNTLPTQESKRSQNAEAAEVLQTPAVTGELEAGTQEPDHPASEAPQQKQSCLQALLRMPFALALAILGICSISYGSSVYLLGTGSYFFLFWFACGGALILWACGLLFGWTRLIPRWLKIATATLLIAGLGAFGWAFSSIMKQVDAEPPAGVDYLIVLGSQVTERGPSTVTRLRLDTAIAYLEANPATICIVTGCQGPNEPWSEALGMRDYLVQQGIAEDRIIMEDKAEDTAQNIAFSMAFIPEGSTVAIVSNNFHIFRSLQIAEKQGLEGAYGLAAPMAPYFFLNNVARESIAIVYYTLTGRI